MSKKLLLLTCASGAITLSAGVGYAATAATSGAAAEPGAASVTELVVTAEHREQSLQKVPVAVSVFTGAQRDTIGIESVTDVAKFAPGFSYNPANVHAYIRGVGRQSVNVTDDQRVSNYEDGFYVYSPYGLGRSSLFLSQEQIERGPQNVGGRNADAGSIDMIDVRPTDTPYAEVRATVGNFGTYKIEGAASGPIAPNLTGRIAGFYNNQDQGFYSNLAGGPSEGGRVHDWYLEGQLEWKPNDKFDLWVHAYTAAWDGFGNAGSRLSYFNGSWDETNVTDANAYVGGGLFINPNYGYSALTGVRAPGNPVVTGVSLYNKTLLNNPAASNPYNFAAPIPRTVKLDNYDDFNFIATYHFPTFDVKYNAGVQGYDYRLNYSAADPSGGSNVQSFTLAARPGVTPLTINPAIDANYVEDDYWTAHDLTFESTTDSRLQWIGGAFFFYQHYNQPYSVSDNQQPQLMNPGCIAASLCGVAGAAAPANPTGQILYLDYQFNVLSAAGYGQLSYKLNDQWRVTGNIRYSYDDKSGTEASRYIYFGANVLNPLSYALGANTPSLDITPTQVCLSGNPQHCNTAAFGLGTGVRSMGVIEPNGYAYRQLGLTSDAVTGGADIEWTPTPDIFTYFRYGRGYESGSFNAGQVLANPGVQPEFLNSYELGYKQTFGHSLLVDLAAFYYDYENMQLPISVANGGLTQSQFINVPKAESTGVEMESYWTPIRPLMVTFSYSFDYTAILTGCSGKVTNGALTQATGSLCLVDTNDPAAVARGATPYPGQTTAVRDQSVKGNPLPNAPENKLAVNVAYTWDFQPGALTLSGTYSWLDSQTGDVFGRYYSTAPSWDDVDFQAIWKGDHDKYEIIGFVRNVFNTLQYDVGPAGVGLLGNANSYTTAAKGLYESSLLQMTTPRTYGMEVRYKFF